MSVSALGKLEARIAAQAAELSRALTAARDASGERDKAHAALETLRVAALKAPPSPPSPPASGPAASAPAVITDAAILEENELTEKRERLVAEQQRLQAEGTRLKEAGCAKGPEAGRVKQALGQPPQARVTAPRSVQAARRRGRQGNGGDGGDGMTPRDPQV